jgi:hypothetical protein
MNALLLVMVSLIVAIVAAGAALWSLVRRRNLQYWIGSYVRSAPVRRRYAENSPCEVLIAVCDHFEPECYGASRRTAQNRVARWVNEYPQRFDKFRDADGRPPQHSFFFPQDEYRPEYLDALADLCRQGYGDVDIHLHHAADTADSLRQKLEDFRDTLHDRHGLLRTDPETGRVVYGFIHGNWALCNSRPDGRWCGVDQELTVLHDTGCYADFTLPSAPSATQTRTINSIYYAHDSPGRCKSHDAGIAARTGVSPPPDSLLMVQGPLLLDWNQRKLGVLPGIENADIHAGRPATWDRLKLWLRARVHVSGRPDVVFVKLHTHGCKDGNIDTWLGDDMQRFHQQLAAPRASSLGFVTDMSPRGRWRSACMNWRTDHAFRQPVATATSMNQSRHSCCRADDDQFSIVSPVSDHACAQKGRATHFRPDHQTTRTTACLSPPLPAGRRRLSSRCRCRRPHAGRPSPRSRSRRCCTSWRQSCCWF